MKTFETGQKLVRISDESKFLAFIIQTLTVIENYPKVGTNMLTHHSTVVLILLQQVRREFLDQ